MTEMPSIASMFDVQNPVEDPVRKDLMKMIMDRYHNTPRHQQIELGPSEIGTPCMRKLALGLMAEPPCHSEGDPLPSIIGTASHTWMDSAAKLANELLGRERWLHEYRVWPDTVLHGSADLFDKDTGTVIDHKFPGVRRFEMYKKNMSETFRRQGHLYGLGFENLGYKVNRVVVALFPRAGRLAGMHIWGEPYDRALALDTLARRDQTIQLIEDLDVENHPDRYAWIPHTNYGDCVFCDYYAAVPENGRQCDGKK